MKMQYNKWCCEPHTLDLGGTEMIDQNQKVLTERVHIAFFVYLFSYAMPAIVLAGDMPFGFMTVALSFYGLVGGLEPGQTAASYFGVVANLSFALGYASFRGHLKRRKPSFQASFGLTRLAACCALGSALSLSMGSETFYPTIGYFAWLGSMIFMSFACWKLTKIVTNEPGTAPNDGPDEDVSSLIPLPTVSFECHCGKMLDVNISQAGLVTHCPSCNQEVTVPSFSDLRRPAQ